MGTKGEDWIGGDNFDQSEHTMKHFTSQLDATIGNIAQDDDSYFPLSNGEKSFATEQVVNHYRHSLSNLCDTDMAIAVDAISCVNYIASRTKRDVLKQSVELEWKFVALIVDRLLFLIYVFTIVFTLSSVLIWRLITTQSPIDNKTHFE